MAELDDGVALSFSERGATVGHAVVFLPGPTDSWRSYEPVLAAYPGDRRVVAVSLRGHGDSTKPPSGYGIEDLARDVVPFLDALGIERAVLAGHSGSCLVARRVALDAPHRVAGLVLEASPTTLRGDAELLRFVDGVVADLIDPIDPGFARAFVADTSADGLDQGLVERLVEDVLKVPVPVWKEMFGSLYDYDDTANLNQLSAPAVLIWGAADQLVPRTMQERLLQLLPQSELFEYRGAGHTPRWEQPERFARDVEAFASQVLA